VSDSTRGLLSKIWEVIIPDFDVSADAGGQERRVHSEGSGSIWERLHYDWSDPQHIVLTTTDSNLWGGHSGHTYTLTRQPNGTTDVDVAIVREGKNFEGRLLGAFLGIIGKGVLEKAFANSLKAIEARNYGVSTAAKTDANKS